jgi:hypothetical protein
MPASSSGAAPAGGAAPGKPAYTRHIREKRLAGPGATLGGMVETTFPTTEYFRAVRSRSDRAMIRDEWIRQAIERPVSEAVQSDGRIRRWALISEANGRALRVVLLPDQMTVHNAFFDRTFRP